MNSQFSKDWQLREMLGNNLEGLSNLVREILLGTDGVAWADKMRNSFPEWELL